jgi:hypothetical protein
VKPVELSGTERGNIIEKNNECEINRTQISET